MNNLIQDFRYGARMMVKRPGFTLVATITLALGIGANTAIFSVVNAVLLRPLPYHEPERLVNVYGSFPGLGVARTLTSVPEFTDYRRQAGSFEALAAFDDFSANLTAGDGGDPERVEAMVVTADFFSVLKVTPYVGRIFLNEEAQRERDDVVMVGHSLWQRRFGGDANLVGSKVLVNGRSHTVVGIMPPGFAFPQESELWKPLWFPAEQYDERRRSSRGLSVIGRLKPGASLDQAQAEMDGLAAQFEQQYPQHYASSARWKINVVSLLDDFVGDVRPAMLLLAGAVVFVLLIACVNVANLLLAAAQARRQEIAIRLALGATRAEVMRQLLTESVMLALAGGALGLLLAVWGVDVMLKLAPRGVPRIHDVGLDGLVLAFTLAASLLTGMLFGLAPALTASRQGIHGTLREAGRSQTGCASHRRLLHALVASEVALAMVLMAGAGLMLKSFARLQRVDSGFNPDGVLTMRLNLPYATYPREAARAAFYREALERIKALPGVEAVGASTRIPLAEQGNTHGAISSETSTVTPNDLSIESDWRLVTPEYFRAMSISLVRGRAFTEGDDESSPPAAIVDESFANRFWPNEEPIGKRIKRGSSDSKSPWATVIGVARQVKNHRLDAESRAQVYFPFFQDASPFNMSLAIRANVSDPLTLSPAVRAAIQSVDRNQPVFDVKTVQQIMADSTAPQRFSASLLGLFAVVALLLSAIGIYGVMSYSVTERRQEIGIRMALGARAGDVLKMIILQGIRMALIGITVGLAASLTLTRLMERLLFGVSATDPLTFATVSTLLTLIALVACYVPARRATKVDPMIALRCE